MPAPPDYRRVDCVQHAKDERWKKPAEARPDERNQRPLQIRRGEGALRYESIILEPD
jgi:hypothetical protein